MPRQIFDELILIYITENSLLIPTSIQLFNTNTTKTKPVITKPSFIYFSNLQDHGNFLKSEETLRSFSIKSLLILSLIIITESVLKQPASQSPDRNNSQSK